MNLGKNVSETLERRTKSNRRAQKIKFDRRDKKIYFIIALLVSVWFVMSLIVAFCSDWIVLPDSIIIICLAAFYPLMILTPVLWLRFFDVCLYLKRLKAHGYEVPADRRVYDRLLERLPRKEIAIPLKRMNDSVINTAVSGGITAGILCYNIWYLTEYQWAFPCIVNFIGLAIWLIVTLRYAVQISNVLYKDDVEPDETRRTRESLMEALMGIFLLLAFSLVAIEAVVSFTRAWMKNTIPDTQAVSTELQTSAEPVSTEPQTSAEPVSTEPQTSAEPIITDGQIDYEDTSQISQLITVGDLNIDVYQEGSLLYFYHPNEDNGLEDSDGASACWKLVW